MFFVSDIDTCMLDKDSYGMEPEKVQDQVLYMINCIRRGFYPWKYVQGSGVYCIEKDTFLIVCVFQEESYRMLAFLRDKHISLSGIFSDHYLIDVVRKLKGTLDERLSITV